MSAINEDTNEILPVGEIPFSKKKPVSIIEYVQTEFSSFEEKPFCAVDSLVLSQLCYMNLKNVVPGIGNAMDAVTIQSLYRAERFDEYTINTLIPKMNVKLINAICASPRFRDIKIGLFIEVSDEEREKQFCAMTFFLPTGEAYVCYRGTDTTINGWKEDFNMFFMDTIPGQIDAARYLKMVSEVTRRPLLVGGHSKGGNLAMFAASFVGQAVQNRIVTVFNHDGPGLTKGAMEREDFSDISEKINITLPCASIIGLVFCHGNYSVVSSKRIGIMQHDSYSWEISDGDFIYEEQVKPGANKLIDSVYELMDSLDREDRELFIDTVFDIIYSAGATTFGEFPAMALKSRDKIMAAMKNLDPRTTAKVKSVIGELIKSVAKKSFTIPEGERAKFSASLERLTDTTEKITRRVSEATEMLADTKDKITEKLSEGALKINETTDRLTDIIGGKVEKAMEILKREDTEKNNFKPE